MIFGVFGPLVFARHVGIMHDFNEGESITFAEHGIHLQKPRLEFTGHSLCEVNFEMDFLEQLTTAPAAGILLLSSLLRSHRSYALIVAGKPVGGWSSLFVLTEKSAAHHWYSNRGTVQHATVKVSLREYA